MIQEPHKKHLHGGMSSEGFFQPDLILKELGNLEGKNFLDVGCGDGHFSLATSKLVGDKGKVLAIDIDKKSIDTLQKEIKTSNIKNVNALVLDITKGTPLKNNSIDVCIMVNVLHGFAANKEIDTVLKELIRLLKVNGAIVIIDFKKINGTPGPDLSIRLSPEDVKNIFSLYNYKTEKIFKVGSFHYGMIFHKEFS